MQHEPTYRQTLRHAWRLTWHNKSLWGLGLLAALFAGSFGINNFLGQLITSMSNQGEVVIFYMPNFNYLPGSIPTGYFALSILSLVMLAILVAIIYISIVSKTALLNAMAEYYKKKYAPRLGKIWNKSLDYFWQIFTIEVGRKIAFFLLLFIFGLVWVNLASTESAWGIIFTSLLLLITLVIALVIASISIFASGYVVIDNQPVKESLKNAYKL